MPKTDDPAKRAENARKERERVARIKDARTRLAALRPQHRDAVQDRADALFDAAPKPKKARVDYLEQALAEAEPAQPKAPQVPRQPKPGPREKSKPKEAGRPEPEHKGPAVLATVSVTVPEGGTGYCDRCDSHKPESEFWPVKVTAKSKRRKICRTCYNAEWRQWDERRRAAAAS